MNYGIVKQTVVILWRTSMQVHVCKDVWSCTLLRLSQTIVGGFDKKNISKYNFPTSSGMLKLQETRIVML